MSFKNIYLQEDVCGFVALADLGELFVGHLHLETADIFGFLLACANAFGTGDAFLFINLFRILG